MLRWVQQYIEVVVWDQRKLQDKRNEVIQQRFGKRAALHHQPPLHTVTTIICEAQGRFSFREIIEGKERRTTLCIYVKHQRRIMARPP